MNRQPRTRTAVAAAGLGLLVGALVAGPAVAATPPTPIPVGIPPVAVISVPGTVFAGIPVTLTGAKSSTSDAAGISEWEWDLDGNGRYEHDSLSTPWVTKTFKAGKHTVGLRVRNQSGLIGTATKTIRVRKAPSAVAPPSAPTAVTATVHGTSIDVTWQEPLGETPLAYRVTNGTDLDTDAVYVPAASSHSVTFDDLVAGSYTVKVAAVNAKGTGPATSADASVVPKSGAGASTSATPTPGVTDSVTPTDTASVVASNGATSAGSSGSGSSDHGVLGLALIGLGVVLLVGAGVGAAISARRRNA